VDTSGAYYGHRDKDGHIVAFKHDHFEEGMVLMDRIEQEGVEEFRCPRCPVTDFPTIRLAALPQEA
jgi:hypothetical protein